MSRKVSVIVPVWNPGQYFDRCLNSLRAQSLPPDEFEVIFVDDASTDGTAETLDAVCAEHAHFRVIHIPRSGWPGKPRNIGIDAARGEYIQFLDNDDTLGPEALQRLYDLGHAHDADIVIGKVTSDFRGVPHNVFRRTVTQCTLHDAPLVESLTPHKMFSRAFLDRSPDVRYPEGKRRLEDQLFMMKAYVAAKRVSILADYPCYFYRKRDDGSNAGSARIQPQSYYANLREVLDVIVRHTDPGEQRTALLERFYRNECLSRLGGAILGYDDPFRQEIFQEVCGVAEEYFDAEVTRRLPGAIRPRALAVRTHRVDDLMSLASRYNGISAWTELADLEWRHGQLLIQARTRLVHGDSSPVPFLLRGDRLYLDASVCGPGLPLETRDVTEEVPRILADVTIRERDTSVEFFLPGSFTYEFEPLGRGPNGERVALTCVVRARLDPLTALGGEAMHRSVWDFFLRVHMFGWTRNGRLGAHRRDPATRGAQPTLIGPDRTLVIPYWTTPHDNLSIGIDQAAKSLRGAVRTAATSGRVRHEHARLGVTMRTPLVLGPDVDRVDGRLHLTEVTTGHTVAEPATLVSTPDDATAFLRATFRRGMTPDGTTVTPGRWRLTFIADQTSGGFTLPLQATLRAGRWRAQVSTATQRPAVPLPVRLIRRLPAPIRRGLAQMIRHLAA